MSDAPSLNPVMAIAIGLPAAGSVNWPLAPKVKVPLAPVS